MFHQGLADVSRGGVDVPLGVRLWILHPGLLPRFLVI